MGGGKCPSDVVRGCPGDRRHLGTSQGGALNPLEFQEGVLFKGPALIKVCKSKESKEL